jgi:hypothetical protein
LVPLQHKLDLAFDPIRLHADLERLWGEAWIAHFNRDYFSGAWSGIPLRGSEKRQGSLFADGEGADFVDTAALERCAYFREVADSFVCEKRSMRLLRLDPGAVIREHRDYDLGPDQGQVRIHVPILTNSDVSFFVANRRVVMAEGEAWYLDLGQPHRVANRGPTPRVHLVLDLVVNDWLRDRIPFGSDQDRPQPTFPPPPPSPAAVQALRAFRERAKRDPTLQAELREIEDRILFIDETVRLGAEHGFEFGAVEVEAALVEESTRWHAEVVG